MILYPPDGKCDFCNQPEVAWEYPARSFTIPGPDGLPFTSQGAWAACAACGECIETGGPGALMERYLLGKPDHVKPVLRPWGRRLHAGFFANRVGERAPATRRRIDADVLR